MEESDESDDENEIVGQPRTENDLETLEDGDAPELPGQSDSEDNGDSSDEGQGRKRNRAQELEESDSSDDDTFDLPLIHTKRPRHSVLDDNDD